jgi:adenosylcobinamide-GDP ribazoletransferase
MAAMVRETLEEGKVALQFLTRLPVPDPVPCRAGALAAAAPLFPLVGALIGALGAAAFALASGLGLPPALAALLAVAEPRSSRSCAIRGSAASARWRWRW